MMNCNCTTPRLPKRALSGITANQFFRTSARIWSQIGPEIRAHRIAQQFRLLPVCPGDGGSCSFRADPGPIQVAYHDAALPATAARDIMDRFLDSRLRRRQLGLALVLAGPVLSRRFKSEFRLLHGLDLRWRRSLGRAGQRGQRGRSILRRERRLDFRRFGNARRPRAAADPAAGDWAV